MADKSWEFEREVRFAVVIYGGVSLAIYINGVVQEMLRLVRATALPEDQLKHSEKVYRKLACILGIGNENTQSPADDLDDFWDLYVESVPEKDNDGLYPLVKALAGAKPRTRFVVDILSGTSAGGHQFHLSGESSGEWAAARPARVHVDQSGGYRPATE